ncbi:beta-1,6-N-acetylglucosaminyltransferase [Vibrio breoganii]
MKIKIAFLCLAHNNFEYLKELKRYCVSDDDSFFLHVDSKAEFDNKSFRGKNVYLIGNEDRVNTKWGTFSIVEATIKLMEMAKTQCDYDYYILLSGYDIPLRSKTTLKKELEKHHGIISVWNSCEFNNPKSVENLKISCRDVNKYMKKRIYQEFFHYHNYNFQFMNLGYLQNQPSRVRLYIGVFLKRLLSKLKSNKNFDFKKYYKGSQWWAINESMVDYCLEFNRAEQFHHMHAPDEKYFHTLLMNSVFKNQMTVSNGNEFLEGTHYIRWESDGMKEIGTENFNLAIASEALFTRKLNINNKEFFINHIRSITS